MRRLHRTSFPHQHRAPLVAVVAPILAVACSDGTRSAIEHGPAPEHAGATPAAVARLDALSAAFPTFLQRSSGVELSRTSAGSFRVEPGGMATARAIPGSRLLMFGDMAHDLPRNRWDEIIDAIVTNTQRAKIDEQVH